MLWRGGKYDGKRGVTVLEAVPTSVSETIKVLVGHEMLKLSFPCRTLFPETSTERPGYVSADKASPIVWVPGTRVAIIGAGFNGITGLIGNYAVTIPSSVQLHSRHTAVQILSEGPFESQMFVIDEDSLCRSHAEPLEWIGGRIVM